MHLKQQLAKVQAHYQALKEYHDYIQKSGFDFSLDSFEELSTQDRAVLEAYLKRLASLQDYLGAKVFRALLDRAGISYSKMSEVLTLVEKEEIIDLDRWIAFRNLRNDLEHDYPDELDDALRDLKVCFDGFEEMAEIVKRVFAFAGEYDETL